MNRMKLLLTLAIPVCLSQNVQAQTSSRLTAQAHWLNDGAIFKQNDSTAYNYSNGRGGDLEHALKFDDATNWIYLGDTAYGNAYKYYQTFNANNTLNSTTTQNWNGTSWVNFSKTLCFYDASGNLNNKIYQLWGGSNWVNISNDVYSYTAGSQLYSDQYQVWNGTTSVFDPSSQKIYYYNASGTMSQEIDQIYNSGIGAFDYSARYSYTYNTANKQLTNTYSTWNGSAWVNNSMYTNAYDTTGNKVSMLYQTYNGTTAAWDNVNLHNYSNFTSGMPQTDIYQIWDATGTGSWDNMMQYTYTYNGFSQLTSSVGESWNVGGFWEHANGDPKANYYYATYTTSVANVSNKGGDAKIYPVPVQNTMNIDLKWDAAQVATITIVDVQGRVISTMETPNVAQFSTSIAAGAFATGVYFVKISGAQGEIVKQIVVAH